MAGPKKLRNTANGERVYNTDAVDNFLGEMGTTIQTLRQEVASLRALVQELLAKDNIAIFNATDLASAEQFSQSNPSHLVLIRGA